MKTIRYILTVLFIAVGLIPVSAQDTHQRALYNYRNDGNFHAFMDIDVDSITFSCIDTLGVEHEDIVVQEVWTPDSVYRIPLEAIDSIGFWAPKPELTSDVFYLRDYHASYTTSIDNRTLYLSSGINRDSIPTIGQVLLSVTKMTPYEEGFAGKVIDVKNGSKGITVVCEEVSIGDIFKKLVLVGKVSNDVESSPSRIRRKSGSAPWVNIEDFDVFPMELDEIEIPIGDLLKITSPTPKLTCSYYLYISELYYEGSVKLDLYHPDLTYTLTLTGEQLKRYSSYGKALMATFTDNEACKKWLEDYKKGKVEAYDKEKEKEDEELFKSFFEKTKIKIPIPIPTQGLLNLELELAPIVKARGSIEFDAEFKTDAWQSMTVKWKGFTPLKIIGLGHGLPDIPDLDVYVRQDPIKSIKADIKVTGAFTLGFKTLLDINLIHYDLIHLGVGCDFNLFEAGVDLNMTIMDTEQPEMNWYDRFKDTDIKVSSYATIYAEAGISPYKWFNGKFFKTKLYKKEKVYNLFPHFTEPALPEYNNGHWQGKQPLTLFSYPSKDIYLPCKIGLRVVDDQGVPVKDYQSSLQYLDELDWYNKSIDLDVSGLPTGGSYKCYPTISFFGLKPFNAGPAHKLYTPLNLVASPAEVNLIKDESTTVEFFGGWDEFDIELIDDNSVATIQRSTEGEGRRITVMAKQAGTASLQIKDLRTNQVITVPIAVSDYAQLSLSKTSSTLQMGTNEIVKISSGSGEYIVDIQPADVVKATLYTLKEGHANLLIHPLKAGTAVITVTDAKSGQTATITVMVEKTYIPAQAIDLGLPSGLLWASYNLGASSPDDYGNYYAFAETEPKAVYSWETYQHGNGETGKPKDLGDISGTQYDPARATWGSEWRTPTYAECQELLKQCTAEWTSENGVNGYKLTGPNGNYIFLPAGGGTDEDETSAQGQYGWYWTSTQDDGDWVTHARAIVFTETVLNFNGYVRCLGFLIRPVTRQKSDNYAEASLADIADVKLVSTVYDRKSSYPNQMNFDVSATLSQTDGVEEWGIYFDNRPGIKSFPFSEVANQQTISLYYNGSEGLMHVDMDAFRVELSDEVGAYIKKRDKTTGELKTIYGEKFKFSLLYDTKPSLVLTDPKIVKTVQTGVEDGVPRYRTDITHGYILTGAFWIDYVDSGVSGGAWTFEGHEADNPAWYPEEDGTGQLSWVATYGESSDMEHTNWRIVHLRNSTTFNTNYVNFFGDKVLTDVWLSNTPFYKVKRKAVAHSVGNGQPAFSKNHVISVIPDGAGLRKALPTHVREVDYKGGILGQYE